MVKRGRRWEIQALGLRDDRSEPKSTRWRSFDLRGPLPLKTTRALETAIQSLPDNVPWPEIDEEAWWRDVLSDACVRAPLHTGGLVEALAAGRACPMQIKIAPSPPAHSALNKPYALSGIVIERRICAAYRQ
jgi:hypothetical protein